MIMAGSKTIRLHIGLYEMPDGMYVASCAEVPHCRILRQNKEHAFQDAKRYILQFLKERQAEGRPFTPLELRAVDFPLPE
jgi:predicted RNase H-like HicB family nuclease